VFVLQKGVQYSVFIQETQFFTSHYEYNLTIVRWTNLFPMKYLVTSVIIFMAELVTTNNLIQINDLSVCVCPYLQVTVLGGTTLEELSEWLEDHGLALPVLPAIQEQTIAGAISTGTGRHGHQQLGILWC